MCCVVGHVLVGSDDLTASGYLGKRDPGGRNDCKSLGRDFGHVVDLCDEVRGYSESRALTDQMCLLGLRGSHSFYGQFDGIYNSEVKMVDGLRYLAVRP